MQVTVGQILDTDNAVTRWKSLELPAPMALTLALYISAIQPAVSGYYEQVKRGQKEIRELREEITKKAEKAVEGTEKPPKPDFSPVEAVADEINEQLKEAAQVPVQLSIGKIPLSAVVKAKIKPTVEELVSVVWLVDMDMDINADLPEYEEAKPLKKEQNVQPTA